MGGCDRVADLASAHPCTGYHWHREANQLSSPDMPCPQGTDALSPLRPQIHGDMDAHNQLVQVRCDAASLGVPCTNCVAFQIECRIPTPKRKKTQNAAAQSKDSDRYIGRPPKLSLDAMPNATGGKGCRFRASASACLEGPA